MLLFYQVIISFRLRPAGIRLGRFIPQERIERKWGKELFIMKEMRVENGDLFLRNERRNKSLPPEKHWYAARFLPE